MKATVIVLFTCTITMRFEPRGVGTSPDKGTVQVHTLIFVRLLTKLLLMLHACHLGASTLNFVAT